MRKFVLVDYSEVNMSAVNKQMVYAEVWYVKADESIWKPRWKS
jgi:hypothetical protein